MSSVACVGLQGESAFSESDKQRVRAHLEELLASQPFAGSRRGQAFLRYVVEETLAGRGSTIKETNIAVDVFGRGRDFDGQDSSVVRVAGVELRKRLKQAYSLGLGQELRIELPPGGYQPIFQFGSQTADEPEPAAASTSVPKLPRLKDRRAWIGIAAGIVVVGAVAVSLLAMFHPPTPLDLMWRPFLDKDRPVEVSIVTPVLLRINPMHQFQYLPLDPAKSIPATELVVLRDSYVGTGGAMAAARFAEQLTNRKQRFDLKFGTDVNFADLKNSPSILIGVSFLTQRLTQGARFQLQMNAEGIKIVDSKQKDRVWERPRRNYASPPPADGYSLITRFVHSDSGHPLLMIASMDSHNTQAAVEFLTQNDAFRQFARSAPADWSTKNFQVVLHNTIYGTSAGSLKVVASEVW